jgi:hypothetical protein
MKKDIVLKKSILEYLENALLGGIMKVFLVPGVIYGKTSILQQRTYGIYENMPKSTIIMKSA